MTPQLSLETVKIVRQKSTFIIMFLVLLGSISCNQGRVISIKAAVVYNLGGAQPVARTKFYLLKEDLKVIDDSNETGYLNPNTAENLNAVAGTSLKPGINEEGIKDFIVATTMTDFEGNAKFNTVPPGNYYIAGFTTTRSETGYLVWSVKIDTEKNNETVLLDQNNAFDSGR